MRINNFAAILLLVLTVSRTAAEPTLHINCNSTKSVAPVKYGLHYEEIGMMGDGALHAELIRNRSFEEANHPAGLSIKDGKYQGVPDPNGRNKRVAYVDELVGWCTLPLSYSPIFVSRTDRSPINEKNRHSMSVRVSEDITNYDDAMVVNRGYFGMNLEVGVEYNLSLFVRDVNYHDSFDVVLVDEYGATVSNSVSINSEDKSWQKQCAVLRPTRGVRRGMLAIKPKKEGEFMIDVVSMFPSSTWDRGRSVFRADILQNIKEYAPDFIRFPGGCIVHGANVETMYKWKSTIGATEERVGQWSKWAPYYRTDGIGYHEFYELCEYVGADAMYVTSTGMVCTGWVKQSSPWNFIQPNVDLNYYTQDALDAIEYAIGDTSTRWGAERAKNGHPEPFPLKYVEIGNEDFGATYWGRYEQMYKALSSKYPDLIYIANSIIGKENEDKRGDISNFVDPSNVKIFDEHYYNTIEWASDNHYKFDGYPRGVADLFIGELGIDGEYPANQLATGAMRMALERNSDMNSMLAERPVMRQWDFVEHRGKQTMLLNSVDSSVKSSLFYISKLFRDNTYDTYIESRIDGFDSMQDIFVTMGYDSRSKEYILKLINLGNEDVMLDCVVNGLSTKVKSVMTTLDLESGVFNTPDNPDLVAPIESKVKLDLTAPLSINATSMIVYRFK